MSKSKHTPGLLYVFDSIAIKHRQPDESSHQMICQHVEGRTFDEADANALRLVDCWNACEEASIVDTSVIPELMRLVMELAGSPGDSANVSTSSMLKLFNQAQGRKP